MKRSLFFVFLLFPLFGNSQSGFDSLIETKFNNGPAVSVLVSKDFKPTYSITKGMANLENKIPAHAGSKFRIGSVTKQFTAVAILQLMERGKLHLNDSIQKFLPNFPVKKHTITIEHLLTHTSGLKEVTELEVFSTDLMLKGIDPELLINYFKDYPLEFEPGTEFRYSNSGYHLLGLIVQKVSGMEYNKYIKKNLFEPAGMENSMAGDNRELISNRVSGYEKANSSIVNAAYLDMSIPFSAGNLLSTTSDINKWYKALFQYQLIPEGTLEKALTPYRFKDSSSSKYGYGWFIDSLQGEKVVSHEGGINGFLSSVWYSPKNKTLAVVLSNCMCNPTTSTTKRLLAVAIGKPLPQVKTMALPARALQRFEGKYDMGGQTWQFLVKDGNLHLRFEGGGGYPVSPTSQNQFYAEEWDCYFTFEEQAGGMQLLLKYPGGEASGKRLEP